MNLVMRVSDQVVALDFGRKIADGTPDEVQRQPRGRARLSRERGMSAPILEVEGSRRLLRPGRRRCTALDFDGRGGRRDRAARRQRRRQDDDAARDLRHDPPRGRDPLRAARRSAARSTEDIARLGVAHVPDGRGTFTDLTVEENLRLGAYVRARPARRSRAGFRPHVRLFPAARRAPPPAGGHAVGRRAADAGDRARAADAAEPAAARRAVVRPRAADRGEIFRILARDQPRGGRQHADRRAERHARARSRRPAPI